MGAVLAFTHHLETIACGECGIQFAMPSATLKERQDEAGKFWCPNGHQRVFKRSEADRLRQELEREQQARKRAEELRNASQKEAEDARLQARFARGKLKALKGRVKNGVCPCCQRSFVQLARHMATKHPDFAAEDAAQSGK